MSPATGCGRSTGSFIRGRDGGCVKRESARAGFHASRLTFPASFFASLKIVNGDFFHKRLHALRDEFEVLRMHLVIVLSLLAGENGVERDLISLFNHRPRAAHHFSDLKKGQARNGFKKLVRTGNDFVGGIGLGRIGPENDNMTETGDNL